MKTDKGRRPAGYNQMTPVEKENGGQRVPDGWHTMTEAERAFGGHQPPAGWHTMTPNEQRRFIEESRKSRGGYWPK